VNPTRIPTAIPGDLLALRRFAELMDQAFVIPGTRVRFGIDAVAGLIPGIGDFAGGVMSMWILAGAYRHRVPPVKIAGMVWNIVLDLMVGLIPVLGDVFDLVFRENVANVETLIAHRDTTRPPRGIGHFVVILALLLALLIALVVGTLSLIFTVGGRVLEQLQ
jgi:hypothetical protein